MRRMQSAAAGRAGRRALGFVLFLMLPSCGGGSGTPAPAPRFIVATHGSADFDLPDDTSCPWYLDFSIYLEDGGLGWVSLEHEDIGSNLVEVSWQESAGAIEIEGEGFADGLFVTDPYYQAGVGWKDLSIRVTDEDRDGTSEIGEASVTLLCDEYSFFGDEYEDDTDFDLVSDSDSALLYFEESDGTEPLFPWADSFSVRSTHPLLIETLDTSQLLADGAPIAATVSPLNPQGPLADGIVFDPTDAVPFAAEIAIDAGGTADADGAPVELAAFTIQTMSDPGPLTQNPGFETTGGWLNLRATSGFHEMRPPQGSRFGYGGSGSRDMVGYFDVPSGATKLSFESALYNDMDCFNEPWLEVQARVNLPRKTEQVSPIACESCESWGDIIPWHTTTYDLSAVAGERVVVRVHPAYYSECAVGAYPELTLDDFRIE